jgi:hypothetical protein
MSARHARREFLVHLGRHSLAGGLLAGALPSRALRAEDPSGPALEELTFQDARQRSRTLSGQVLTTAQDGGLLVEGQDGRLWTIEPQDLTSRHSLSAPFTPWTMRELTAALERELPRGFEFTSTKHYLVATQAGKAYAQWCAGLFERLFQAFQNYWRQRDLEPSAPVFPLVAIVLKDERQFAQFAAADVGPEVAEAKGYYSIMHNRIVLYDLTSGDRAPATTAAEIARSVSAHPFNIATVVHEATHQIAFNSGLHVRMADNPLWLTEGMAMFFETPDLTSRSGWRTVGLVNDVRLKRFLEFAAKRRRADSLETLVSSDARLADAETAVDAYAEAWALTYFLLRTRQPAYCRLLRKLREQPRLHWLTAAERLADFREHVADNLTRLDQEFLRYIRKIKA